MTTSTRSAKLAGATRRFRRSYDRLYVASMKAGSEEESARIDAQLAAANARYDAAKAAYGKES